VNTLVTIDYAHYIPVAESILAQLKMVAQGQGVLIQRLDRLVIKVDALVVGCEELNARLVVLDQKLVRMEQRLERIEHRLEVIEDHLWNNETPGRGSA